VKDGKDPSIRYEILARGNHGLAVEFRHEDPRQDSILRAAFSCFLRAAGGVETGSAGSAGRSRFSVSGITPENLEEAARKTAETACTTTYAEVIRMRGPFPGEPEYLHLHPGSHPKELLRYAAAHCRAGNTPFPCYARNAEYRIVPVSKFNFNRKAMAGKNPERIEAYAALVREGLAFPPVLAVPRENGRFLLCEGYHRLAAAKAAGTASIPAVVLLRRPPAG